MIPAVFCRLDGQVADRKTKSHRPGLKCAFLVTTTPGVHFLILERF